VIIVAPLGLVLIILLVVLVVVVIRNSDRPTKEEELGAKTWAIAQADLRDARARGTSVTPLRGTAKGSRKRGCG
jgi:hypothetical protein